MNERKGDSDAALSSKLALLHFARELRNVSLACRKSGVGRSTFYRVKKAFEAHGASGLEHRLRRRPRMPNAIPESAVRQILDVTAKYPHSSYRSIANRLGSLGMVVSGSSIQKLWRKLEITRNKERVAWAEEWPR